MKTKFAITHLYRILLVILACVVITTQVTNAQESAPEEGWPREIIVPEGKIKMYQPQLESFEVNWIPTGEDFFLLFRLYGPDKPLFEKSWKLADVER